MKYSVAVWMYSIRILEREGFRYETKISCDAIFYLDKDTWFEVELGNCENKTSEEILNFFEDTYNKMCCVPDIYNN